MNLLVVRVVHEGPESPAKKDFTAALASKLFRAWL